MNDSCRHSISHTSIISRNATCGITRKNVIDKKTTHTNTDHCQGFHHMNSKNTHPDRFSSFLNREGVTFNRFDRRGDQCVAIFTLHAPQYQYNEYGKSSLINEAIFNKTSLEMRVKNLKKNHHDCTESERVLNMWPDNKSV